MKEKIYTIPVTDAFNADCECPLCTMKHTLEKDALDYVMGPSYMEDDVRTVTNEMGFCSYHVEVLSKQKNTLGLALMLQTHIMTTRQKLLKLTTTTKAKSSGLFNKKSELSPLQEFSDKLEHSCYVCNKVDNVFNRYIDTIFMLWNKEASFRETFASSKGFCIQHFALLHSEAEKRMSSKDFTEFATILNKLFFDNLDRVSDDIEWFVKKFDYQYQNEPWKNSKDAVPRMITKANSKIL